MLMVLMNGKPAAREGVIRDLMECNRGTVQCVSLNHVNDPQRRIAMLQLQLGRNPGKGQRHITLINNPTSPDEVAALRQHGAHFVHVYGALNPIYDHITVEPADLQVLPKDRFTKHTPAHVHTPAEVLSQCMRDYRQKWCKG